MVEYAYLKLKTRFSKVESKEKLKESILRYSKNNHYRGAFLIADYIGKFHDREILNAIENEGVKNIVYSILGEKEKIDTLRLSKEIIDIKRIAMEESIKASAKIGVGVGLLGITYSMTNSELLVKVVGIALACYSLYTIIDKIFIEYFRERRILKNILNI